jgi:TolA-binding protein
MKLSRIVPWLCVAGLAALAAAMYFSNEKLQKEVAQLRQDNQALQAQREDTNAAPQNVADELARLRKDNEDLLRLRNDVRQLRQEKQQLSAQLQTAQSQVQSVQTQMQNAQAQSQAAAANAGLGQTAGAQPGVPGGRLSPELAANVCINNLRQMDGAKEQWALQNNKPAYTLVSVRDITPYLHSNNLPACPLGGAYTLNAVGVAPACTVPGHALQK